MINPFSRYILQPVAELCQYRLQLLICTVARIDTVGQIFQQSPGLLPEGVAGIRLLIVKLLQRVLKDNLCKTTAHTFNAGIGQIPLSRIRGIDKEMNMRV